MDPRLDTGGWLALTETPYGLSSRQGLSPCKIRQAFPGAITVSVSRPGLRGTLLYYTENIAAEQDGSDNVGRPWVGYTLG